MNVQIYITTYNRPESILDSINSVLKQSYSNFQLIVSDNSSNLVTKQLVENYFSDPPFKYIKREKKMNGIEHLNLVLSEIEADYFMIFHDDDIMHPEMLKTLFNLIHDNPSVMAVATNARIIKKNKRTIRKSFQSDESLLYFYTPEEIAYPYLCKNRMAPFPSYLYRRRVAEEIIMDPRQGGKYSDTSFLIKVIQLGTVVWVNLPLMDYYIHAGQDSYSNDFLAKLSLIYFINSNTEFKLKSRELRNYRLMNIYGNWIFSLRKGLFFSQKKKVLFLFFKYSTFNFLPKIIIRLITIKRK